MHPAYTNLTYKNMTWNIERTRTFDIFANMSEFRIRHKKVFFLPWTSQTPPCYPSAISLPIIILPPAVSSLGITQWPAGWQMTHSAPAWLPLLSSHEPAAHLFLIMVASFRSLSKTHRHKTHTCTQLPPSTTKSKQELSGRSEPCLMQQDERCCRVVENWSLWSWQVGLNNNKLAETASMNGQKDRGEKRRKERQGRGKNRNRQKRTGQRKAEKICEHSEKSEKQTEESGWSMKFWLTMTQRQASKKPKGV